MRCPRIKLTDVSGTDYFSQFHCKLYLPGYRDRLLTLRVDEETPEQCLPQAFADGIPLTTGDNTGLDLVLLWDLPNYLDKQVLTALAAYLAEYCTRRASLHCYIHTRQAMPAQPGDYRLTAEHTVMVDIPAPWTATSPMYYQALLNKAFAPFRVQRGMLLANGLQEYILHTS